MPDDSAVIFVTLGKWPDLLEVLLQLWQYGRVRAKRY
jgi:hypothetical protein